MERLPIKLDHLLDSLWREWDSSPPQAVALLGSHARGDAGPFSDVDLLFLMAGDAPPPERTSFLVDGLLVTVNAVVPEEIDGWFTEPEQVVNVVAALRDARPVQDPTGLFSALQRRANGFVWNASLQAKADRFASRELVGLIEEAHKGLEGLRQSDTGRLLNASFGLSWLLAGAVRVQQGVLSASDNHFFADVRRAVGLESRWSTLLALSFGVSAADEDPPSLAGRVRAGLALYCETARLLDSALQAKDRSLIKATVQRIEFSAEESNAVNRCRVTDKSQKKV
ncbi:MAG: nucleotidyltransferase domain-containing protein [Caldilineaceae bacterium]|nr:nucleotidyltransferase domain-containing protein [Caldilineaceae bacterium]